MRVLLGVAGQAAVEVGPRLFFGAVLGRSAFFREGVVVEFEVWQVGPGLRGVVARAFCGHCLSAIELGVGRLHGLIITHEPESQYGNRDENEGSSGSDHSGSATRKYRPPIGEVFTARRPG